MESEVDLAPSENAYEDERATLLMSFTTGSPDTVTTESPESESLVTGANAHEVTTTTSEESEPNMRQKCIEFIENFQEGVLSNEEKEAIIKELDEEKVIRIMVCGLTGADKSTILNGLVGRKVFTEGDILSHETTEITTHTIREPNCNAEVIVYDTPGFCDASGNEEEYIRSVKEKCSNIDVLIYCLSVCSTRAIMDNDIATLKQLKLALDTDVWKRCVIVLTFANAIVSVLEQKKTWNAKDEFRKKIEQWKNEVHKSFKEAGIDSANVPIVLAGCRNKPSLFGGSKVYWLSQIWYAIFDRTSTDGKIVLLLINSHRFKSHEDIDSSAEIFDQPIVVEREPTWLKKHFPKLLGIAGIAGAGGAAGATGAGIGATIGALAIGIPSFGVAAGVGLLLGAAVGGGIGIGVSAVTAVAIAKIKGRLNSDE